tara:strand:- start:439 stop:960 length:522 start_codon:yes stop_codon:yes gene_type:complete
MIVWLIGISGSGKTTLGEELCRRFRSNGKHVVFLDGDVFRSVFHNNNSVELYDDEYRRMVGRQLTKLCMLLDRQGVDVICCTISQFNDLRIDHRDSFSNYIEIHMDCSVEDAARRDIKKLYSAFNEGKIKNVVGCDLTYEKPTSPDLIIETGKDQFDLNDVASYVSKFIENRL